MNDKDLIKSFSVAIDGPVAAGKGTIAQLLAKKLNGFYLYTGAMYRCLALECIRRGIDFDNKQSVISILSKTDVEFSDNNVFLNGEDVTEIIKKEDVAKGSAKVAIIPEVRKHMVVKQQEIAKSFLNKGKIVVSEGRDTATRVLPQANLKIFLIAKPEVRAKRRLKQFREQGNTTITFAEVLEGIKKRDKLDLERKTDPLVSNPDNFGYIVLDNSEMTERETLNKIIKQIK